MRTADDDRELRNVHAGHGGDQFSTVLGDTAGFVGLADHESRDVLQEDEWNPSLPAEFHKVGAFLAGFREQDTVVGHNANLVAVDVGKSTHERGAVARFEFVESGTVNNACD